MSCRYARVFPLNRVVVPADDRYTVEGAFFYFLDTLFRVYWSNAERIAEMNFWLVRAHPVFILRFYFFSVKLS